MGGDGSQCTQACLPNRSDSAAIRAHTSTHSIGHLATIRQLVDANAHRKIVRISNIDLVLCTYLLSCYAAVIGLWLNHILQDGTVEDVFLDDCYHEGKFLEKTHYPCVSSAARMLPAA